MRISRIAVLLILMVSVNARAQVKQSGSVRFLEITEANAGQLQRLNYYPSLEKLSISCLENLKALPESIGALKHLRELIIDNGNGCSMNPLIPESIGNLHSLERLTLYGAQDPRLVGDELEPRPKERHPFPKGMSRLTNLTVLDLGRNGLKEMPSFVRDLVHLQELGFEYNSLKQVPAFVSEMRELKTLKLEANELEDLPDFLNKLPKLSKVTIGQNCKITRDQRKVRDIKRRFPRTKVEFEGEYDCPE